MPDPTILERLQALDLKVDSPERLAMLQAFGAEHYADANFLNLLVEALIVILSAGSGTIATLQQSTDAGNTTNKGIIVENEKWVWLMAGPASGGGGVKISFGDILEMLTPNEADQPYSWKYNELYMARKISGIPADDKGNIPFGNSFMVTKQFATPQTSFTLTEIKGRTKITAVIFNGMVESDPANNMGLIANFVTGAVTSGVPLSGDVSFIILI